MVDCLCRLRDRLGLDAAGFGFAAAEADAVGAVEELLLIGLVTVGESAAIAAVAPVIPTIRTASTRDRRDIPAYLQP